MPHTLYDVPVCQQYISPLAQFVESVTVNHEAIVLTPTWRDFTPFALHINNPQSISRKRENLAIFFQYFTLYLNFGGASYL